MSTVEECGHKLKVLRTNNGQEFTAGEFAARTRHSRMVWSSAGTKLW
jgi:hypothetical protein